MYLTFDKYSLLYESQLKEIDQIFFQKFPSKFKEMPEKSLGKIVIHPISQKIEVEKKLNWERTNPLWGEIKENRFLLSDGFSVATTFYSENRIHYEFNYQSFKDKNFFSRSFIFLPLLELLRSLGFFYVHGSLISDQKKSFLVMGEGGSGKSTLLLSLLENGWNFVGDDHILLQQLENKFIGHSFEEEVRFNESQLINNIPFVLHKSETQKNYFTSSMLTSWKPLLSIDCILLLKDRGPAQIRPLEKSNVFQQLILDNPMIQSDTVYSVKQFQVYQALLAQTPCFQLSLPEVNSLKLLKKSFEQLVQNI